MKANTIPKIFLLSLLVCFQATAQNSYQSNFKFDHIFPGDNLRENSVTCFLQDSQGFIWIGTKGGLFRYDGYNFRSFKMEPKEENSLSDNFIRCIIEYSGDEFILIGTDNGGLNIFDKKTGKFLRFLHRDEDSAGISDNSVWDIAEDSAGKIWLATGGGLNLFDIEKRTFKQFPLSQKGSQNKPNNFIRCLYLDRRKKLWVGTRSCGLFYFDIDSKTFHRISDEDDFTALEACDIWSITEDKRGNLWIGTFNRGIYVINLNENKSGKLTNLNKKNGLGNFHIVKISCDSDNTIWVGTWGGGLLWYDEKRNYFGGYQNDENDPESLSSNLVLSFFEDNASTFWIGTHAGGINIYQPQKWKFTPYKFNKIEKNTVHFNSARSIYFDDRSQILYVGSTFGLYEFPYSKNSQINQRQSGKEFRFSNNTNINAIWPERNTQNLWLGTNNGLFRWNRVTNKYRQFKIQLTEAHKPGEGIIIELVGDNKGFLWVITATGKLYRFFPGKEKFEEIRVETIGLQNETAIVSSILIEKNNRIYLGTYKGVMLGNAGTLKFRPLFSDSTKSKKMQKIIITLFRDAQDLLWIGTWESGLYRYDEKTDKLSLFTISDGLPSNHINAILEDENGFLYIGTDNGMSRFDPDKEEFINFSADDGLHSNTFENNSCCKARNGMMFFGGINGYSSVNPGKLALNTFVPPVYITGFDVLHGKNNFNKNILYTSSVTLSYKMNSFTFEFVALNYINSPKNQYLYKLEGYDQEWQDAGDSRKVTYKNVAPGKYTFRVIGSNNDGIWNEKGDSLSIYITPPFWQTLYFKFIAVFLLLSSIYYVINRRFVLLRKESDARRQFARALIERQEGERKRIATELHDSLGQDLLVIKNQSTVLLKSEQDKNKKRLEQIRAVADEAISNIRQIALDLHPYQLGKIGLSDCLRQMIKRTDSSSEINFHYEIESIEGVLSENQALTIYRITQEILNNILKHSRASNAKISIQRTKQFIKMNFSDDGIGFDYDSALAAPQGLGLAGIKERIEILKGDLTVKTKSGAGTEIKILIPIG